MKLTNNISDKEIEDVIAMLDNLAANEVSRMKIKISDELEAGSVKREYHHGRCDINSPWACGASFDVLEDKN